jgi:transglutaminase-like putative cysteine protease
VTLSTSPTPHRRRLRPPPRRLHAAVVTSHAWAEAWLGEWYPFDPANRMPVGERHVLVARGRDHRDVSPLKGVCSGASSSTPTVTVTVELTRRG